MAIYELNKYKVVCDDCDEEATFETTRPAPLDLPEGWSRNHERYEQFCPLCTENREER